MGDNIYNIFKYLIYNFSKSGGISTRQIMKLTYKAELRSIDKFGERLTESTFTRGDHGPINREIYDFIDNEDADVDIKEEKFGEEKERRLFNPNKPNLEIPLQPKTKEILDEIIIEWEPEMAGTIVESTKFMPPYTWTEKKGDRIDFDRYKEHSKNLYSDPKLSDVIKNNIEESEKGNKITFDSYQKLKEHLNNS